MLCRSLLARVCLACAAITDAAAQEQLEKHGKVDVQDMMAVTKVVPQSALIFVKELLGVSDHPWGNVICAWPVRLSGLRAGLPTEGSAAWEWFRVLVLALEPQAV